MISSTIRKPKQYCHGDRNLPHLLEIYLLQCTARTVLYILPIQHMLQNLNPNYIKMLI